jgi:hypothetical protein
VTGVQTCALPIYLFEIERSEFGSFEYAHAWSFVYFLNNYDDGKYAKGFAKFFRELYTTAKGVPYETVPSYGLSGVGKVVKPEDIKALLLKRIGERDVQELERQWHRAREGAGIAYISFQEGTRHTILTALGARMPERMLRAFSRHRDARSLDRYSQPRPSPKAIVRALPRRSSD